MSIHDKYFYWEIRKNIYFSAADDLVFYIPFNII